MRGVPAIKNWWRVLMTMRLRFFLITGRDDSISEDSKRIRLQTADMFRALIDDAKNSD